MNEQSNPFYSVITVSYRCLENQQNIKQSSDLYEMLKHPVSILYNQSNDEVNCNNTLKLLRGYGYFFPFIDFTLLHKYYTYTHKYQYYVSIEFFLSNYFFLFLLRLLLLCSLTKKQVCHPFTLFCYELSVEIKAIK